MEEKLNEALNNAGITEEDLTANGEAARKAMEAKAEHAAASETKIEVEENVIEEDKNMKSKDIKSKVITVLKWTGYCVACAALGFAIGTLIKSGAVAEAAEATAEATE